MSMGDPPDVILEFEQVLCAWHGEPYRKRWPVGYASTSGLLIDMVVMEDETFQEELEQYGGELGLCDMLKEKPLCCRVTPERLLTIYEEVLGGSGGQCDHCSHHRLGTSYSITMRSFWGKAVKNFKHICFECIAFNSMRPKPEGD